MEEKFTDQQIIECRIEAIIKQIKQCYHEFKIGNDSDAKRAKDIALRMWDFMKDELTDNGSTINKYNSGAEPRSTYELVIDCRTVIEHLSLENKYKILYDKEFTNNSITTDEL